MGALSLTHSAGQPERVRDKTPTESDHKRCSILCELGRGRRSRKGCLLDLLWVSVVRNKVLHRQQYLRCSIIGFGWIMVGTLLFFRWIVYVFNVFRFVLVVSALYCSCFLVGLWLFAGFQLGGMDFIGTPLASSPEITLRFPEIYSPPPCVIVCLAADASRKYSTTSLVDFRS